MAPTMMGLLLCLFITVFSTISGCPTELGCACNLTAQSVTCHSLKNITWSELLRVVPPITRELSIIDSVFLIESSNRVDDTDDQLPKFTNVTKLHFLQYFNVQNSDLVNLDDAAFMALPNVKELHLNHVLMTNTTLDHLIHLGDLEVVDLSHNNITYFPEHVIQSWTALQNLDLKHNKLSEFSFHIFGDTSAVNSVDLSHNNIRYVHPEAFKNGTSLDWLNLQSNELRYIHDTVLGNITGTSVDLSHNPWDCHCGLQWLVEALRRRNASVTNQDMKYVQCASPEHLMSRPLVDLTPEEMQCEPPVAVELPQNMTLAYMQRAALHCNISGDPYPSIYWITPHGPVVHPDHRHWVPHDIALAPDHIIFTVNPSLFHPTTAVRAQADGSLIFEHFRYYFSGEYMCVAVNPAGSIEHNVTVTIIVTLRDQVEWSIIWGFSGAGAVLLLSILLGVIFHCSRQFCLPTQKVLAPDLMKPSLMISYPEDYYDDYEDSCSDEEYYFDRSPMGSHQVSPRRSPMKCVTPTEVNYDERKYNEMGGHIRERLESVRLQLRQNMERQMVRMKKNTQTLKQNSHKYIKNVRTSTGKTMKTLRHTSSQYVSKMREGVVLGVEQVKYHVQSMKELCGPGSMTHTISTVSMSTDIDSNQKKHVFKSITYV